MPELKEAQQILRNLGMQSAQQNEMAGLVLLALCGLKPQETWQNARRLSLGVSKGIMAAIERDYGQHYAANTRETFRRQVLHQFVDAGIADYNPDMPNLPTNSPRAHYAITEAALRIVRHYGTADYDRMLNEWKLQRGILSSRSPRETVQISLGNVGKIQMSPGEHNQLQKMVVEQFIPQFAPNAEVLYLGDTAKKDLFVESERLASLQIPADVHDKLPDIILYVADRNWVYLIEVVTSHGPMTPKRVNELRQMLKKCDAGLIFVTAFLTFKEFKGHMQDIAWDTEIWVAEAPIHLIHYNGDRFLGPR